MPAVALSRVGARVVESGPGGQDLVAGAWQRLEALPDPRSPRGRIYPLACLIAIALCAFTAAGNDRFTAVGQWIRRASQQERPMPYVRDSFWRGREFASLEGMQAEAERWSLEVAGRRACPPLEGAAPAAVFEAVERDALRPLPAACSCWRRGRRRRSGPTSTPRSRRCSTRCRGGTSARPPTSGSPARWCSSSSAASW